MSSHASHAHWLDSRASETCNQGLEATLCPWGPDQPKHRVMLTGGTLSLHTAHHGDSTPRPPAGSWAAVLTPLAAQGAQPPSHTGKARECLTNFTACTHARAHTHAHTHTHPHAHTRTHTASLLSRLTSDRLFTRTPGLTIHQSDSPWLPQKPHLWSGRCPWRRVSSGQNGCRLGEP